jgi:hypothetical protein
MSKRRIKNSIIAFTAVAFIAAAALRTSSGQDKSEQRSRTARGTVEGTANVAEEITLKAQQGAKVSVTNLSGRITITGWDRDTVQARTRGDGDQQVIEYRTVGEPPYSRISLNLPHRDIRGRWSEIDIEVSVPRSVQLESVQSRMGDIEIAGVEGGIAVDSRQGSVTLNRVGAISVSLRSGDLVARQVTGDVRARILNGDSLVENVSGRVDLSSANGDIRVQSIEGNVRCTTASGDIQMQCVKGTAEVNTASGDVSLNGVQGDAEAATASGEVVFKGAIRSGGRYRLKSISGDVSMLIQAEPPGFNATLSSYSGDIDTEFRLTIESPVRSGNPQRRILGRYGDGAGDITLDSFSGTVRIAKAPQGGLPTCK